jgi:AcrR family transcriptional regulator
MPRIRDFARTRAQLIEVASRLFSTHGYDRTSVEAIIKQAKVSKGAFYHHFSSKEQLLDAVTAFIVDDALHEIRKTVGDRSVGATGRLNRFLNASKVWRLAHFGLWREVVAVLLRDENAPMLRKIQTLAASLCVPLLAEIIQQGIDEGVFDPPNPVETARLILQLALSTQDAQLRSLLEDMSEETLVVLQQRADLLVEMLERMLGAPAGSVQRLHFVEALRPMVVSAAGTDAMAKAGVE